MGCLLKRLSFEVSLSQVERRLELGELQKTERELGQKKKTSRFSGRSSSGQCAPRALKGAEACKPLT